MRTRISTAAALGFLLGTMASLHAADDAKPAATSPAAEATLEPTPRLEATDPIPFVPHDGLWGSIGPRLSVEYFTGPVFGYYNGYSSFDAVIPVFGRRSTTRCTWTPAASSRTNMLLGQQPGLGYRFYHPPLDRIFGAWTSWTFATRISPPTTR